VNGDSDVKLAALAVSSACLVLERHRVGRVATIKLACRGPLECGEEGSKRGEGKRYYYRSPLFVIARVYSLSLSLL
jgi:hypothetical protein